MSRDEVALQITLRLLDEPEIKDLICKNKPLDSVANSVAELFNGVFNRVTKTENE